jgi:ankyrin repeat protein
VDRLLEIEDIDVNFKSDRPTTTPLRQALELGHETIAERLAADSRIDKEYAFHMAAAFGNLKIVRFFVEQKGIRTDSVSDWGKEAIILALSSSSDETATYLLAKYAFDNPNCPAACYGMSAVDVAAENGLGNALRILLQKGGDISKNSMGSCTSLQLAARQGHERVVELLLEYGADPTAPPGEMPPLIEAAAHGRASVIRILLDRPGVDVNYRGRRNMTPLLHAAFSGHYEAVRVILEFGGEINSQNDFGVTALSFAARCGFTDVVMLLLSYGAKTDMEGGTGITALSSAVKYEHVSIVEMLLSHGANVNSTDTSGEAPLYLAVRNRQEEMVRLLLQRADIELDPRSPEDGLTPLELAEKEGYEEIVMLLLERGAGQPKSPLEDQFLGICVRPNL